jgi:putative MFS transporter
LIPLTALFKFFVKDYGYITSGYIVMAIVTIIALFALSQLRESFGKDLDYVEE